MVVVVEHLRPNRRCHGRSGRRRARRQRSDRLARGYGLDSARDGRGEVGKAVCPAQLGSEIDDAVDAVVICAGCMRNSP